jgi:hypothetical protein
MGGAEAAPISGTDSCHSVNRCCARTGARLRLPGGGALGDVYGEAPPPTVELPPHSGLVLLARGTAPACRAVLTAP